MTRMYVTFALLAIAACGDSGPDPLHDYSKCGDPTTISVTNADVIDGAALALPAGIETDLIVQVTDAEGDFCDPVDLELAFDDAGQIEVVSTGEYTVLKPRFDAIDHGTEPTTVMHVSLGGLSASWTIASVVALGGRWNVTVSEKTRYPNGFDFGEVIFAQRGRRMVWEDCTIPLVCTRDGVVIGSSFTVDAPDVGLMLSAPISSDRRSFSGPWKADQYEGDFTAERIE